MPVFVKLNTYEHTPTKGIEPKLAKIYAKWMAALAIDGLELSSGTLSFSAFHSFRGDVPVNELIRALPFWQKPLGRCSR